MDRFDALRVFVQVVEQRSFTLAAQALDLPRSTASEAIKQLEAKLGVRLLQRTTRQVRPTLDGEEYYRRCLAILADLEDADATFAGARPRGLLRVDVHGTLARRFMLPGLPAFLTEYPEIRIHLGEGDRLVDLVREGVDCVLRVGVPKDSNMVARRVAELEEVTCASPDYIRRFGMPATPDDLEGHRMVGFLSTATGALLPLEFVQDGAVRTTILPHVVSVSGAEIYIAAARMGLGLVQAPRYHVQDDFDRGELVHVLPTYPPTPSPVCLLYPRNRQLSPRVRVFMDWLIAEFEAPTAAELQVHAK